MHVSHLPTRFILATIGTGSCTGDKIKSYDLKADIDSSKRIERMEMAFTSSGNYFICTSPENYALLYQNGNPRPIQTLSGHSNSVVALDWYPLDSSICVTASTDHSVILRRLSSTEDSSSG